MGTANSPKKEIGQRKKRENPHLQIREGNGQSTLGIAGSVGRKGREGKKPTHDCPANREKTLAMGGGTFASFPQSPETRESKNSQKRNSLADLSKYEGEKGKRVGAAHDGERPGTGGRKGNREQHN